MWKIAIIDDDPNLLEGMRNVIPWEELDAQWVGEGIDGQEGMELIRRMQPDIVISDIDMPVMNGLEMIAALRKEQYRGKFVILSGYSDFEYARQALRLAVDDYLSKPITMENLLKVINRVIGELEEERLKELEAHEYGQRLQLFEPYVMKEWLKSLLIGDAFKQPVELESIKEKLARWETQRHMVLCMELDMSEGLKNWFTFDRGLMRFAIQNVVREMMDAFKLEYEYIEMNSRQYALLLHLNEGSLNMEQQMKAVSSKLTEGLKAHTKLDASIGIGSLQENWRKASDSFEDACHRLRGERLEQQGESDTAYDKSKSSVRFYHQLAEAIRNLQEEHAVSLVAGYVSGLRQDGPLHKYEIKQFANELWVIIAYALYDIGIDLRSIYPSFEPQTEANAEHTPDSLRKWLEVMVRTIINSTHMHENVRHRKIVEFMTQYMHEHYMEDITLSVMAEKVQVSRNYLGQIFKNVMNETFNSYVTRIRMERAKSMLLQGNLYIYEVAEKVGYNSISYFSTQFKKYTGSNPTDLIK